jgi:hypothetical protein
MVATSMLGTWSVAGSIFNQTISGSGYEGQGSSAFFRPVTSTNRCIIATDLWQTGQLTNSPVSYYQLIWTNSVTMGASVQPLVPLFGDVIDGADADVSSGLVNRYTFAGNLNDSAGAANGTAHGSVPFVANHRGIAGSAIQTTNGVYVTANAFSIPGTTAYTIAGWFKEGDPSVDNFGASISVDNADNVGTKWRWDGNSDSRITFGQGTQNVQVNYTALNLGSTNWNFVVATFDGTTMKIYINGFFSTSLTVSTSNTVSPLWYFGFDAEGFHPWYGSMDTVSIYNRALSAAEVAQLYAYEYTH